MTWYNQLELTEYIFILAFLLFYALFFFRIYSVAKKLRTGASTVVAKFFLRSFYFLLFIVALLGPSFGETTREIKSVGKDIFIAVDLSQSMNAADVQPSRLEKVKFELKNIINSFSSDRIGLIIFSSEAFMQCPLTFDQSALNLFVETLNTTLVPNTGTNFSPPLNMAFDKLTDDDNSVIQQKSKIIILISDGEDFGKESGDIIEKIEQSGIKLFTLGVGTESGSTIPTQQGFKRDRQGETVVTRLDSRELKSLAVKTGGKYFEINETNNDVSRLINTISQIEGELRDARIVDVSANKYFYFLAAALLLLMLDVVFNTKTIRI
jgi:Ca-activated chloride channel family protein